MQFELSVIIPCLKFSPHLETLLVSLKKQRVQFKFEVIVVFNLPDPQGEEAARRLGAKAICSGRIGVNIARNLGLARANAPVALFLDDDCELVDVDLLDKHLRSHREFPDALAIGGQYLSPVDATATQTAYNSIATQWVESAQLDELGNFDLLGGHVSYKLNRLPPFAQFDSTIEYGGAETEFHLRLIRMGAQLRYDPSLAVLHRPPMGPLRLIYKGIRQGQAHASFGHLLESLTNLARPEVAKKWERQQGLFVRFLIELYHFGFSLGLNGTQLNKLSPFLIVKLSFRYYFRKWMGSILSALHSPRMNRIHLILRMVFFPKERSPIFSQLNSQENHLRTKHL